MHLLKWLYPGMKFKRWLLLFAAGVMLVSLGLALIFNYKYLDAIEEAIFRFVYTWRGSYSYGFTAIAGTAVALLGSGLMLLATLWWERASSSSGWPSCSWPPGSSSVLSSWC